MKKLLAIFLCLILVTSVVSCDKGNEDTDFEKTSGTTEEPSTEDKTPYSFISGQERLSWKDNIMSILSAEKCYEGRGERGCLGAALMNLNLDNTPELIVTYSGGSMGNVCVAVFDLETGEELCWLGYTPHYQVWNNIYLCVCRNNEGNYLIVNKGSLRNGSTWYTIMSSLNNQFNFDALFEEVKSSDDNSRYYCYGNEVEKAEFEQQKNQFKNDYKEITETQVKIVYWKNIDTTTKSGAISAMADALVNSEQQFIDFNK